MKLKPKVVGGGGRGRWGFPEPCLGISLSCSVQAAGVFLQCNAGMLQREIPRGLGESYIGHSAAQAGACSQLASVRIVFVSLDDAFYNSVISSTCFYFEVSFLFVC